MNPLNASLIDLKSTARAAGQHAATIENEHEQTLHLVGAFGGNVRAAWDFAAQHGGDGAALADRLNNITHREAGSPQAP